MKEWKGWWVIFFGLCMFMWGAFLEGTLNQHKPQPHLVLMVSVFTVLSFFGSIKKEK